jgi:hypothetical protein
MQYQSSIYMHRLLAGHAGRIATNNRMGCHVLDDHGSGSNDGAISSNAAPNTRRFPAIVLLLIGCLPSMEFHLVEAPENRRPLQTFNWPGSPFLSQATSQ